MTKGEPIAELRAWRKARSLNLDQAAEELSKRMGRADDPIARATYWAWESGKKLPKPLFMVALCDMAGLDPAVFYPSPAALPPVADARQPALL